MKIYTKIIIDLESGATIHEESFEYFGDIALCGGGSGGSRYQTTTLRYAPYVESHHYGFIKTLNAFRVDVLGSWTTDGDAVSLHNIQSVGGAGSLFDDLVTRAAYEGISLANAKTHDSPWLQYDDIVVEAAFFGTGYTIANFSSLYDTYGTFMSGLDIDALYNQIFENTVNASEIKNLVSAETALLDDDIESNVLPRFQTGMRDINSVMSSSFLTGAAMIEDARLKALAKFSAELKYRMIPVAVDRWKTHLEWNKTVIMTYAEIMKLYYSVKMDVNDVNYSTAAKHLLWPFTVLDYERAALGALQGATKSTTDVGGSSTVSKAISGALSGAAMGAMAFPADPALGAIGGGFLGLAASLF